MTYKKIINEVAKQMGLPRTFVDKTYKAYWRAIKEHITTLPLREDLSDEEFLKLQPNINIPSLGKFHVTLEEYKNRKRIYKNLLENYVTYKKD